MEKWGVMKPLWEGKNKDNFFTQDLDMWTAAQKWAIQSKLINEPVEPPQKYFDPRYLPK